MHAVPNRFIEIRIKNFEIYNFRKKNILKIMIIDNFCYEDFQPMDFNETLRGCHLGAKGCAGAFWVDSNNNGRRTRSKSSVTGLISTVLVLCLAGCFRADARCNQSVQVQYTTQFHTDKHACCGKPLH